MIITKQLKYFILATVLVALINGCTIEEPPANTVEMPEVNDENCKQENILKIENKEIREKFVGLCLRRGDFVPSPKKAW